MAIERGEVERLLGWASIGEIAIQPYGHVARMADSEVIAELCRTWLAVQGAPVAEIDSSGEVVTLIAEGSEMDNAITSARIDTLHGKRVRLVPVGGDA